MTTEEKIVAKALEMFNERGIEYVGLRELAASLAIRVGNITYYFPTKDHLVNRLASDLAVLNSQLFVNDDHVTVRSFLDQYVRMFENHLRYRCLLLSFVHLIEQNKIMAEQYRGTENQRRTTIHSNLLSLQRSGCLKPEADVDFLVSSLTLIVRFWISEASISFRQLSSQEQIKHYATLLAKLLIPYVTPKGQTDIEQFLANLSNQK